MLVCWSDTAATDADAESDETADVRELTSVDSAVDREEVMPEREENAAVCSWLRDATADTRVLVSVESAAAALTSTVDRDADDAEITGTNDATAETRVLTSVESAVLNEVSIN